MKKRALRRLAPQTKPKPAYPTLEAFDADRRAFLARLGGLLGGAALVGLASACGGRPVGAADDPLPPRDPDMTTMGGVADTMSPPGDPDLGMGGVAPDMATPLDASLGVADAMPPRLDGGAADARPDLGGPAGAPPAPDAEVDDGGSCPNP